MTLHWTKTREQPKNFAKIQSDTSWPNIDSEAFDFKTTKPGDQPANPSYKVQQANLEPTNVSKMPSHGPTRGNLRHCNYTFLIKTVLTFWWSDFKWLGFHYGYSYSPDHSKSRPFNIWTLLSGFQMCFHKMAAICLYFKYLGFWISHPISKSGLFATQPLFEHSESKLVWISDTYCIVLVVYLKTSKG